MANEININKEKWKGNKPSTYAIQQLDYISFDRSVNRINEKLDDIRGMSSFSYDSIDSRIKEANELLETLCYYIDGTLDDIAELIDEPFYERFNNKNGILESFERINLDDYETKNELGIKEHVNDHYYDYPNGQYKAHSYSYEKDTIGFKDLLNNMEVKGYQGMPSFSEMMKDQYKAAAENPEMKLSHDDYLEAILHRSDIQHTVDRGWLNFLSDALDTVGIVSAVAIFTGDNFITGEILTDKERETALVNTIINVGLLAVTIATAGAGSVAAIGTKAGVQQTLKIVGKSLAVDMISGAGGLATINLLDALGSPEWLSALAGLGVSFIGGYYGEKAFNSIGKGASGAKNTVDDIITDGSQITKIGNKKTLKPNIVYQDTNGYIYKTDELGRITNAQGELKLGTGKRNPYAQRTVGGTDRLVSDDGGHIIGNQFNASGDIDNLLPQGSVVNRAKGEYYNLEKEWADALKDGAEVKVDITPMFDGVSKRPKEFNVNYSIDGEKFTKNIKNK